MTERAAKQSNGSRTGAAVVAATLAIACAAVALFGRLDRPLLWHDESETAMFATRVLDYGYPKVHGERNVVYSLWHRNGVGIHEATDAYTGSPWAQYYLASLGVAAGRGSDDLYGRTAWVRLPFALAGALGLVLLGALAWPLLGDRRDPRLFAIAAYALALAASVGLMLHLREARYYGLALLEVAGVLWLWQRRPDAGGTLASDVALALLLVALFHTFHPAFGAVGLALALDAGARSGFEPGSVRQRLARFLRRSRGLLLGAALALPALGFFDFFAQTEGWLDRFADPLGPLRNLGFVGATLARHDWLLPALALRLSVGFAIPVGDAPRAHERRRLARLLATVCGVYAVAIAQIPFLFERYFVLLSPLVTLMALLDAVTLTEALRRGTPARAVALASGGLAFALLIGALAVRMPELAGRLQELREPYRGPLDFVIPHLARAHADPAALVIATNYEGPAYMFYLGSRVTVGFYGADLARDRAIQPDVIVPRPWPDHLDVLRELSERVPYAARTFPVENLPWNNNPALSPRHDHPTAHRFTTPVAREGAPALVILEREPDA